jgi:hypothetical protein
MYSVSIFAWIYLQAYIHMITYTVITKSSPGAVSTGLVSVTLYIMIEEVMTIMSLILLIIV